MYNKIRRYPLSWWHQVVTEHVMGLIIGFESTRISTSIRKNRAEVTNRTPKIKKFASFDSDEILQCHLSQVSCWHFYGETRLQHGLFPRNPQVHRLYSFVFLE